MATIVRGLNQDWSRPFETHTYDITIDALTGVIDVPLDTIPDDTYILYAYMLCVVAEVSATTCGLDVEIGGTTVWAVGADALGTKNLDFPTGAEVVAMNDELVSSSGGLLNCEVTYSGTATVAPRFLLSLLAGRSEF